MKKIMISVLFGLSSFAAMTVNANESIKANEVNQSISQDKTVVEVWKDPS